MAKTVRVVVTDDIDGSPGTGTVTFSYDGESYEIDLGAANRAKLEEALQPFIAAGRRTRTGPARPSRTASSRADRAAVRAWAIEQGLPVSARGRISSDVVRKYQAAH